ncbi:MAG: preprotein translocase subunit SecG [Candidatus Gastranaerophilales bacterium]|nr:preprotein translocase subunit SecG [Candidatus Gastranaerophilales bacterium]
MSGLTVILQMAQIFLGVLLTILVLLHSPKGDGMAMLGGAAQLFSSQKGAEKNLTKLTAIVAITFVVVSFLIGFKIV